MIIEKRYVALVASAIAANMLAFAISWWSVEHHTGVELNPNAEFSVSSALSNVLGIAFVGICCLLAAPATRNILFSVLVGCFAADAAWDLQFVPNLIRSSPFEIFFTTLLVASMTPAGVALLEVRRVKREHEWRSSAR